MHPRKIHAVELDEIAAQNFLSFGQERILADAQNGLHEDVVAQQHHCGNGAEV